MTSVAIATPVVLGTSISDALSQIVAAEKLLLPDLVVPTRSLSWSPAGTLTIPSHAEARPNDWSRQQLSSLLGVRFEKWFESASAEERADEMTRRLRRAPGNVRLRLAEIQGTVVLRALVSPGYTPVRDSMILEILGSALTGADARIRRLDLTDRMTAVTICVGKPQSVGGIVGSVWGSITLVNSGVGWSGLSVSVSLLRLACSNGMRAPLINARLIDIRHRHVDMSSLTNQLVGELQNLPSNLTRANRVLADSTSWDIQNIEAEARAILREAGMVRKHLGGVLAAFQREPLPSVFGLSQAITLHAQRTSPEDRVALEDLAGTYVLRAEP